MKTCDAKLKGLGQNRGSQLHEKGSEKKNRKPACKLAIFYFSGGVKSMHEAQIEQMLAMNITPLELFYTEVRDVISTARTKAYKTEVLVRSVSLGDLNASQYQPTANRSNQCIAVAMWALTQICREITELVAAEQDMDWYSIHIPLKFIEKADMEATLRTVFEAEEFKYRDKLMLEFPPEAIYLDTEVLKAAINGAKNAGVRCMLTGVGSENYPVIRLASLPLDMVQTHESVAQSFRDEEEAVNAAALVTYLRSISLKVLVTGIGADEDAIAAGLERLGCSGMITPTPATYNVQYMLDEIARERGDLLAETMQAYKEEADIETPTEENAPVETDVPEENAPVETDVPEDPNPEENAPVETDVSEDPNPEENTPVGTGVPDGPNPEDPNPEENAPVGTDVPEDPNPEQTPADDDAPAEIVLTKELPPLV